MKHSRWLYRGGRIYPLSYHGKAEEEVKSAGGLAEPANERKKTAIAA
jgi:hypothetical protein